MTALTYNDFYNQLGLVEAALMNPPVGATWPQKAWFSMASRFKGDALNDDFTTAYAAAPNIAALRSMWWTDIVGWIAVYPSATNTCTNAGVSVYDFQIQFFNTSTQAWELVSNAGNRNCLNLGYYTLNTFAYDTSADAIFNSRVNIPKFCCTKSSLDRGGLSTDITKYRAIHNGLSRYTFADPTLVGGVAVLCRAKIEPISGSLNGVPSFVMQVGADAYPDSTTQTNTGLFSGIPTAPALGASAFSLLGTTERTFLYVTANINPNGYIETRSDYVRGAPAGTYPELMPAALFAANVPQFKTF